MSVTLCSGGVKTRGTWHARRRGGGSGLDAGVGLVIMVIESMPATRECYRSTETRLRPRVLHRRRRRLGYTHLPHSKEADTQRGALPRGDDGRNDVREG